MRLVKAKTTLLSDQRPARVLSRLTSDESACLTRTVSNGRVRSLRSLGCPDPASTPPMRHGLHRLASCDAPSLLDHATMQARPSSLKHHPPHSLHPRHPLASQTRLSEHRAPAAQPSSRLFISSRSAREAYVRHQLATCAMRGARIVRVSCADSHCSKANVRRMSGASESGQRPSREKFKCPRSPQRRPPNWRPPS